MGGEENILVSILLVPLFAPLALRLDTSPSRSSVQTTS